MTMQMPRLILVALAIAVCSFLNVVSSNGSPPQDSTADDAATALAPQESKDDPAPDQGWWIGISCEETSKLLQRQLKIDGGLAIEYLADKAPAQITGLMVDDIIVRMNDQLVTSVNQLNELIQTSQGAAIDFEILRDGQKANLNVTPEKRPACDKAIALVITGDSGEEPDESELAKIRALIRSQPAGTNVKVILVRPGVVLKDDSRTSDELSSETDGKSRCELHFSFKEFESDTLLLSEADLGENKIVSGCLVKLTGVIEEQIAKRKVDLEQLKLDDEKPVGDDFKNRIEALKSQLKMLEETRELLKQEIERNQESDSSGDSANDEQSTHCRPHCRQWS